MSLGNILLIPGLGGLGPELRANLVVSTAGTPTILATYNTGTGVGTVNRESAANSSGLTMTVVNGAKYRVDIEPTNLAPNGVDIRQGSVTGTQLAINVTTRSVLEVTPTSTVLAISGGGTGVPNVRGIIVHSIRRVL